MRRLITLFSALALLSAAAVAQAAGPIAPGPSYPAPAPTGTTPPTTTGSTTTGPTTTGLPTGGSHRYVNPFADRHWVAGRIDMGMDWAPLRRLPVLAVGDGVVLGSSSHSGWPGGRFIYYQLLDGSHAGDIIYVAEHLRALVPAGTHVRAGQRIATALPGYPYIETGWADTWGSPRAYPCYKEGRRTNSGREMERFLVSLGAWPGEAVAAGPTAPAGRRC